MKLALDTNVLVYAHLPSLSDHPTVRAYLLERLAEEETVLVVTPLVLHEFLHIVTDARRFDPPVEMAEAVALTHNYLERRNVECLPVDEAAVSLALEIMAAKRLGRKRIADTLLAATLLSHGVETLVTCDSGHFDTYEGLQLIDPR